MQCVNRITALLFGGLLLCVLIYLPMLTEAQQSTDKDWARLDNKRKLDYLIGQFLSDKPKDDSLLVERLHKLSLPPTEPNYYKLSEVSLKLLSINREHAEAFGRKQLAMAKKLGEPYMLTHAYLRMCDITSTQFTGKVAAGYLDTVLQMQAEHNFKDLEGTIQYNKAKVALNSGNYKYALDQLVKALQFYRATGDSVNMASVRLSLGNLLIDMKDYKRSVTYLLQAEEFYKKTNRPEDLFGIRLNLGIAYYRSDSMDLARKYFNRLISFYHPKGNYEKLAQVYYNLGSLENIDGNYMKSMRYADSVIRFSRLLHMNVGITLGNLLKAENLVLTGQSATAIKLLDVISKEPVFRNNAEARSQVYELYSLAFRDMKDSNRELFYLKKHHQVKDSLSEARNSTLLFNIEEQMLKKDLENEVLRLETAKVKTAKQRNGLFYIMVLSILTLFGASIFLTGRKRANALRSQLIEEENRNLRLSLELKDREIATKSLQLHDADTNHKSWNEFQHHFEKVHADFYHHLAHHCSDLSPVELKIAGLMRLKLTSKEIAAIMNRSEGTVRNHRCNLRKKLNIDSDDNLMVFLMKL